MGMTVFEEDHKVEGDVNDSNASREQSLAHGLHHSACSLVPKNLMMQRQDLVDMICAIQTGLQILRVGNYGTCMSSCPCLCHGMSIMVMHDSENKSHYCSTQKGLWVGFLVEENVQKSSF